MSINRFDPLRELVSLRDARDRLFEDGVIRPATLRGDGRTASLPIDLRETADGCVQQAAPPGVKPERLDVSATPEGVTIEAEGAEAEVDHGEHGRRARRGEVPVTDRGAAGAGMPSHGRAVLFRNEHREERP